ncbi:MAG: nuclear transport factor 2 family protein [Pseudomonadota bacterium]
MKILHMALLCCALAAVSTHSHSQAAPFSVSAAQQLEMLNSTDSRLERNKRFVFDFWRIVFEGGHMEDAPKYLEETYIQHNPNIPTGRAAFIERIGKARPPQPVVDYIKVPVVSIVAERDIVTVSSVRKVRNPKSPDQFYYMTWFDMFRIGKSGLIAEHWDAADLWTSSGKPPGLEFLP